MVTRTIFSISADLSPTLRKARKHKLARMGLAWLIMMQVMMLAFPGYLRSGTHPLDSSNTLDRAIILMNWSSLVLCVPLILYCALPLWQGFYTDIKRKKIGMDTPVAFSIIASFIPSIITTITHSGEVYFDSVSMFIAFLLTARFLETSARQTLTTSQKADALLLSHADHLAFWFVCAQILLALIVGIYWWQFNPTQALPVIVALLVMSCPCALSMSVPCAVAACQFAINKNNNLSAFVNQQTQRIAKQNLYGSLAWHLLMTPLAAIGLVEPWLAAVSMLISSLAVAANSWRLSKINSDGYLVQTKFG